jgi:hypothetical protein
MKYRNYIFILLAILVVGLAVFLSRRSDRQQESKRVESTLVPPLKPASTSLPAASPLSEATNQRIIVQPPPAGVSAKEKWKWLAEMERKDLYFTYKAPISFYGRVIDDSGNPVSGVSIDLSWTDANEATGNYTRTVISDGNGLFSIKDVHGAALIVAALSKQGYKESLVQNTFTFHYGYFSDPYYHSPDSMNPVVFVMRKNREAEPLIEYSEKRAEVGQGQKKRFTIGPNDIDLIFERMTNAPEKGGWISRVTVPGGGLALTTEEFPFEAPMDGYVDSIIITNGTPKPPNWPGFYGAMLYFKTSQGYGRVMVRYISNMDRMFVTAWFNPNPNSRNLEIDPSKVNVIRP